MKCSVFIAKSLDGFIAKKNNNLDWLSNAGNKDTEMNGQEDMGMNTFLESVDCIIMGRKTIEVISDMKLTQAQWPYGNIRIIILSNTLLKPPVNTSENLEIYSGDIKLLISNLQSEGFKNVYIDGGKTIQSFIDLELVTHITITVAPVLIGEGIPLFGKIKKDIKLINATSIAFPNDFIQISYEVKY